MKKNLIIIATVLLLFACKNQTTQSDASGVFEVTEVMVSAQASGEIMRFDVLEGLNLQENQVVGYIDTMQLFLKKKQLLANIKIVESRVSDVSKQIATIQQQITTQKTEQKRFESLVNSGAAPQKQLDDINAHIAVLEKQLIAQTDLLETSNRSISAEIAGLVVQISQIDDQIQKSIIRNPIDGVVLSKYAEQGEFTTQGRSLFKVADIENMKLRVYITADQLTSLKIGQRVKVLADQGKSDHREYDGTIIWISDKAEFTPKTIQTRDERANLVYAIKIAVKNDGYIKRGMYGEIKIQD
jgi:HlyD family secretion protein